MVSTGLFLIAFGALLLAGAGLDWEWFMNNYKSRRLVRLVGRDKARIVYGLIGVALAALGALIALGVLG